MKGNTMPEQTETDQTVDDATDQPVDQLDEADAEQTEGEAPAAPEHETETFPRKVVEDLRRENANYRTKAQRADDLAARLHSALVAATGRLADPSDLPFEESHVDDPEALTAAIDELLTRKPHLASRRPVGDVGQGASASADTVDLAEMLRARAN